MATLEDLRRELMSELEEEGIVAHAGHAPSDIYAVVPPFGTLMVVSVERLPERSFKGRSKKPNSRAAWLDRVEAAGAIVFFCDDPKELLLILDARLTSGEAS